MECEEHIIRNIFDDFLLIVLEDNNSVQIKLSDLKDIKENFINKKINI